MTSFGHHSSWRVVFQLVCPSPIFIAESSPLKFGDLEKAGSLRSRRTRISVEPTSCGRQQKNLLMSLADLEASGLLAGLGSAAAQESEGFYTPSVDFIKLINFEFKLLRLGTHTGSTMHSKNIPLFFIVASLTSTSLG